MIDSEKLKAKMKEAGYTQYQLAEAIGIDNSTFIRKMKNGGEGFSVGQLKRMTEVLSISGQDAASIFLN